MDNVVAAPAVWMPLVSAIPSHQPAAFAVLLVFKNGNGGGKGNGGGGGGCPNQPEKGQNCATVPEGGSTPAYLGLAGFACVGAIVYRRRRNYAE